MSCFKLPDIILDEIQQMAARFWWGSSSDKKKLHWLSWDKLSCNKSNGGLGFRNLRAFNLAMLSKQAWRILTSPSSLLSRVLKAKYFPDRDFLAASLGSRPSWSWRSILETRPLIRLGARRLIRSGNSTRIWFDPWIPRHSDFHPRTTPNTLHPNATVSALIDAPTKTWKEDLIKSIFSPEDAQAILSISLSSSTSNDLWCWHFNKNGKHSVRSAYHTYLESEFSPLRSASIATSSAGPNPLWKTIWKLKIQPKIKLFLWRNCSSSIPTPDNLARHGLTDSSPPICSSPDNSASHIFFSCPFPTSVWRHAGLHKLIAHFQQPSWRLWLQELLLQGDIPIELIAVLCSQIWFHRNEIQI
ncbi:hypothetical protein DH2020_006923 [Rehmannia glutinosa]|uniref:Reverse transcriptase zinc-binding domain-containing protein n=1 Tax=Rehmannia glutinosa TaxID=99300 RepID=A0ABR0XKK0_REHGL